MKIIILCEGTTDLLMLQFVLQYKYHWKYEGFVENSVTNRLIKRKFIKNDSKVEICSCGGIMNISNEMVRVKETIEYATKVDEIFDKVIIMIDHDTENSNQEFIRKLNELLGVDFGLERINAETNWSIENNILGNKNISLYIKCVPEKETGAIENVMLDALNTDAVENLLIDRSKEFITKLDTEQDRYLQRKSRLYKAIFNTYFAIRTPEEKYDERARILKAFDWEKNECLEKQFSFLDIDI